MKRFHVHVGVDDLAASIRFYNTLFASPPVIVRPHQLLLLNQREELDRRPAGHPMGDVLYDW